jgi:hypothetical protein
MSEWQPIETAPMYGNNFVLLTGGEPDGCHWADEPIPPIVVAYYENGGWVLAKYDSDMATVYYTNPTRWRRLPEVPKCPFSRFEIRVLHAIGGNASTYFIPDDVAKSKAVASLYANGYITSPFDGDLTDKGKAALGKIS